MGLGRLKLCFVLIFWAAPAWADDHATKAVSAVQNWMHDHGIAVGQIAVAYRGDIRGTYANERTGAVDLASLSKAITATCVRSLVSDGVLGWEDNVGDHVADLPSAFSSIPLHTLLTHTSGLHPDNTQRAMTRWRGVGDPVYEHVVINSAKRDILGPDYRYNNENYAVIAHVITAATGLPYADVCAERVLVPAGVVSAVPSPDFGRFAAWGGWQMDLADYTRFLWQAYGQGDPADLPHTDLGGGAQYGLGMIWRSFRDGHNYWHAGSLCFWNGPRFVTFAVLFETGWSLAVYAKGCPEGDMLGNLSQTIAEVFYP